MRDLYNIPNFFHQKLCNIDNLDSIDPEAFRAGDAVIRVVESGNGERHLGKNLHFSQLFVTEGDFFAGTAHVETVVLMSRVKD